MEEGTWVQVMVVPISAASADYAREVRAALRSAGFSADLDVADSKMEKKIREAQLEQYNYIVVRRAALCLNEKECVLQGPISRRQSMTALMLCHAANQTAWPLFSLSEKQ